MSLTDTADSTDLSLARLCLTRCWNQAAVSCIKNPYDPCDP